MAIASSSRTLSAGNSKHCYDAATASENTMQNTGTRYTTKFAKPLQLVHLLISILQSVYEAVKILN